MPSRRRTPRACRSTRQALSDADRKLVNDGLLEACDALDGQKDGLVFAAPSCKFDPAVLACKGAKTDSCLRAAQVAAVKKVMAGPKASDGRQVYPGYLWDTGITTTQGGLPGVLVGPPIPEGPGHRHHDECGCAGGGGPRRARDGRRLQCLDQPQHLQGPRRQAHLLPRP